MAPPPPADRVPLQVFPLKFCTVSFYDYFVWTQFPDGEGWGGEPGDDRSYRRLSFKLGYRANTLRYCQEHDFCHSFVWEQVMGEPSPIMWSLSHGLPHPRITCAEEALVQAFQGFLRGHDGDGQFDMTATAPDVDWCAIRDRAFKMLGRRLYSGSTSLP